MATSTESLPPPGWDREGLDGLLNAFPEGRLSEIVGPRSSGGGSLLLALLARAALRGGLVALVDGADAFDPETAMRAGLDLRVFGPWRRKLAKDSPVRAQLEHGFFSPQRMAEIFAACKATLNIHTWRGRFDHGLNPRVFEAAACGVPQLIDHKKELGEIFDPAQRAGMLIYRDDDELLRLARQATENAAELRSRALEASASFRRDHSYRARVAELLRVVGAAA